MLSRALPVLSCIISTAVAQPPAKYAVSPAGMEYVAGNSNNTYPFLGVSSSYQQVHDAVDLAVLNGRQPLIFTGMHFRPASGPPILARTLECQVTLGITPITAATMSTTYATNIGPNPTVVLPYTRFSLPSAPAATGNPRPPLWKFPFTVTFPYTPAAGNLCWDWRQRNAGTRIGTPMDAVDGTLNIPPLIAPNFGSGCVPSGQAAAARADLSINAGTLTAGLTSAAMSAPAFMAIGLDRITGSIGWCTPLYTNPLILLPGMTDAAGNWKAGSAPSSVLSVRPYAEFYAQFAFADTGLPGGVGLSDLGVATAPPNGGNYVSRVWTIGNAGGSETATTGTLGLRYGLVTMFTIR